MDSPGGGLRFIYNLVRSCRQPRVRLPTLDRGAHDEDRLSRRRQGRVAFRSHLGRRHRLSGHRVSMRAIQRGSLTCARSWRAVIALKETECCALARTNYRSRTLRWRARCPQLKRDPLGSPALDRMSSAFVLAVDSRAVSLAVDAYLQHPDEGGGELVRLARVHEVLLSGPTWAVALLYDPADSSSSLHGMIQRKLSLLVPRGLTIGAWSTPRVQWAAGAFPALPVSHQCETPAPASVLPVAGPASSFTFPTTSCANAGGLVGSHRKGRAA